MSRIDYQPAWRHYQAFDRHPMDYKYRCGFDPEHKTLKQCVDHWESCGSPECQEKARDWPILKDEVIFSWKRLK